MVKRVQKQQPQIPIDTEMSKSLRTMLANMCGEVDRVPELFKPIDHKDFPDSLSFERDVMRLYNDFSSRDIPPTRTHLITGLRLQLGYSDQHLERDLDALLAKATENRSVESLSYFITYNIQARKIQDASQIAHDLVMQPIGDITDNLNAAVEILTAVADADGVSERYSSAELPSYYLEVIESRERARENGILLPSLKYKGFVGEFDEYGNPVKEGVIPHLLWGQTTLISALAGTGKTTIGQDLAEHNAWWLGHDVLYLHLETEPWDMMDRSIARWTLIPTNYLISKLSMKDRDNPLTKTVSSFLNFTKAKEKKIMGKIPPRTSGDLVYHYIPGWNVTQINAAIRIMRSRAQARGRALLVFLDYYQIINYEGYNTNRAEALGQIARLLRDNIKKENTKASKDGSGQVHLVIFSQETEEGSGSTHTYGSKEIIQYVQVYMSLKRELASSDQIVFDGKGNPSLDALGSPRLWHRNGEASSDVEFHILKGNRSSKGIVKVKMEGKFFRMEG